MIEHTPNKFNAYLTKEIKENPNLPKELEEIGEQIDDRVRVHDEAVEAYKKRLVEKLETNRAGWISAGMPDEFIAGYKIAVTLVEATD